MRAAAPLLFCALALACSDPGVIAGPPDGARQADAGRDAGRRDSGRDAARDVGRDAPVDVGIDAVDYDAGPPPPWDEVYALFSGPRCGGITGCHYVAASGGLSLRTSAVACAELFGASTPPCGIRQRVLPGDPARSLLYLKLAGPVPVGCGGRMPAGGTLFTPVETEVVRRWIAAGAVCP